MFTNEKGITASSDTDNLSWMDDDNGNDLRATTESDSSSLDNNSESVGHGITAISSNFFSFKNF